MNDEQLKKIQEELLKEINDDIKQKEVLSDLTESITSSLMISKKTKALIAEREYDIICKIAYNKTNLIAADSMKMKMLQGKYIPYTASADYVKQISERENIKAVVSALINHINGGEMQAEELED